MNIHNSTSKSCIQLYIIVYFSPALNPLYIRGRTEDSEKKWFFHHQPVTARPWDAVPHTFVPHLPPVCDSLGSLGVKRVKTTPPPHSFPWDLVSLGTFQRDPNTDSPLFYQRHQACRLSHQEGTCHCLQWADWSSNSTSSVSPPLATPESLLCPDSDLLSNAQASGEFFYFILISDKPRVAASPSFPCFTSWTP